MSEHPSLKLKPGSILCYIILFRLKILNDPEIESPQIFWLGCKIFSWDVGNVVMIENVSSYFDSLKFRIEAFVHRYIQMLNYMCNTHFRCTKILSKRKYHSGRGGSNSIVLQYCCKVLQYVGICNITEYWNKYCKISKCCNKYYNI